MLTCAANRAPLWEFGVRIRSERQGPVWHCAPRTSLPAGVRTVLQTLRYLGHSIMSLWCVVSISDGMCVPISAAGPQRPHTLSLGLRGGFFGRQCVSWHPARSNTPCTPFTIRARVCGDRTCVLMTALWLCWRWVPTGSANSLVFCRSSGPWFVLFVPVMCILPHVILWCLLFHCLFTMCRQPQAKTI